MRLRRRRKLSFSRVGGSTFFRAEEVNHAECATKRGLSSIGGAIGTARALWSCRGQGQVEGLYLGRDDGGGDHHLDTRDASRRGHAKDRPVFSRFRGDQHGAKHSSRTRG